MSYSGAGSLFYDPSSDMLKMHCRYSHIDTPAFYVFGTESELADDVALQRLVDEEMNGFPLFVKPEHTFDSIL